jgi:hypothetical protein
VSGLAQELKEQNWKRYQLFKHRSYSAVASVAAYIMACIVYKLYMYSKGNCSTSCPRIGARRLGEVRSSPELSSQGNTVNINVGTGNVSLPVTPDSIPLQCNPQATTENPKRSLRPCVAKSVVLNTQQEECEPT